MSNRNDLPSGGPATRNEKRAERAFRALLAYGIEEGDVEGAVTDLLTDMRHLSGQYGWTLDELAERSSRSYEFEVLEAEAEARGNEG